MSQDVQRGTWGSRMGFILAATGSAIGLGNLWKFPYITHENGGGAFLLVYLCAIVIIGLPIMVAELLAGKSTQQNPWGAFRALSAQSSHPLAKAPWYLIGGIGILSGFIILSYYSVVAGWTLEYAFKGLTGQFKGLSSKQMTQEFVQFLGNPTKQLGYHFTFMGLTIGIVILGVAKGIERATRILMPILFALITLLVFYSATVGAFGKSLHFLFAPNFSQLTGHGILEAVGHAFFTLSLGMGAMLTYGSYLRKQDGIAQPAIAITFFDTLIALMACLMIYPILFGNFGMKTGGVGILFTSLPVVFMKMPMGSLIAPVFFILVGFAALSSTISLLEVVVSFGVDEFKWNRKKATLLLGGSIFLFGIPSALCNGAVGFFTKLKLLPKGNGKWLNWFDSFDYLTSNWLLPIGGLLTALFVGWVMDKKLQESQEPNESWRPVILLSRFFLRYISPVAVLIVLLNKVGVIDLKPKPKATPAAQVQKVQPRKRATVHVQQPKKKIQTPSSTSKKPIARPTHR